MSLSPPLRSGSAELSSCPRLVTTGASPQTAFESHSLREVPSASGTTEHSVPEEWQSGTAAATSGIRLAAFAATP